MGFGSGHGATISFGTIGGSYAFRSIGGYEESGERIDLSHMGLATYREYAQPDLYDLSPFSVQLLDDTAEELPPAKTSDTVTVTMPTRAGETTPATIVGTAVVTRRKFADMESGVEMLSEFDVAWLVKPTYTKGSAT